MAVSGRFRPSDDLSKLPVFRPEVHALSCPEDHGQAKHHDLGATAGDSYEARHCRGSRQNGSRPTSIRRWIGETIKFEAFNSLIDRQPGLNAGSRFES
jgi:hypothetical protein